jgi:hypothetical protein
MVLARLFFTIAAGCILGGTGCGSASNPPTSEPPRAQGSANVAASSSQPSSVKAQEPTLPRRSEAESAELMTECVRGTRPSGSVRSLELTDVFCSKIYRRPACARAWYEMSIAFTTPRTASDKFDEKPYVVAMVDRCRDEYCGGATNQPTLCSRSAELSKASVRAFVKWLLEEELTIPGEHSGSWARSLYFGAWLR